MYSPLRLMRFAAVTLPALALSGCATMIVSSYMERGADIARYQTYTWAPADSLATGDPRLDNNPFFQERVQANVEKQLDARGFEKASERPDLLIHYHASISQRIDFNGPDRETGDCVDCRPYVFDAGTLLVDLVDARTNKLVWRGWAEDSVDGVIDNQKWMEEKIDEAVRRMMEMLPPRRL